MRKKGTLIAVMKQMIESLDSDRNKSGTNMGRRNNMIPNICMLVCMLCMVCVTVYATICVWRECMCGNNSQCPILARNMCISVMQHLIPGQGMLNLCLLYNFLHQSHEEVIEQGALVRISGVCPVSYGDDTLGSCDNPCSTMTEESTKISGNRMYGSLVMSATGVVNSLSVVPKSTFMLDTPRRFDYKLIVLDSTYIYENVLICVSVDANVYIVRMFNYIVQECMTEQRIICVRHHVCLRVVSFMCVYETIMSYFSVFSYSHIVNSILMLCDMVIVSCASIVYVYRVATEP